MIDNVNHPAHYTSDKSGVECIEITRHRNFNIGNAIKYLWRAGIKDAETSVKHIEDLQKAIFYITREIENIEDDLEDSYAAGEENDSFTAEWIKALYDAIEDDDVSQSEFDELAERNGDVIDYIAERKASMESHPAGKKFADNSNFAELEEEDSFDDDDVPLDDEGYPCDCGVCYEGADEREDEPKLASGGYTGVDWLKGFEVVNRFDDGSFSFTTDMFKKISDSKKYDAIKFANNNPKVNDSDIGGW